MNPVAALTKGLLSLVNAIVTQLDDEAWRFLAPHENKIVCLDITEIATLYFRITPTGLQLFNAAEHVHVDSTFKGTLATFIALILSKRAVHQDLHIRGDLECAKALYDTWQHLDCDWEGTVSEWTHPTLAHGLFTGLRKSRDWFEARTENSLHDIGAFLQNEMPILPTAGEVDALLHSIEQCRDDVERFEAKMALFEKGFL